MISFARPTEYSSEGSLQPAIETEQTRTRDKIFNTVGYATGLGTDTARFLAQETAYVAGVTIHTGMTGIRALYRGVTGQQHP